MKRTDSINASMAPAEAGIPLTAGPTTPNPVQRSAMTHGPDPLSGDHRDWEFPWIDLGGEG
jgi:hypothetical protein